MDSGTSVSIIYDPFICMRKTSMNKLFTIAESFLTLCDTEAKIKLPELNLTAHIFVAFHTTSQKSNHNVTFGRDFLRELGINLDFQNNFVSWKETKISTKMMSILHKNIKNSTNRFKRI